MFKRDFFNKESIKRFLSKNQYHIIAFAIPVIVMIGAYIIRQVRPFGIGSILAIDLWGQYFPMIANYISDFFEGDLLFSWNGAFGYNAVAQNAYYTLSPLNLLLFFFPRSLWVSVIDYLPVLRMGLASLSFSILLKYKFKESNIITTVFSSAYGLSMYFHAFNSQLMWQDAVVLFPLLIMGIDKLLSERKMLLYGITLAVTLLSNFYIGFSICIFSAMFFVVEVLTRLKKANIKYQLGNCMIFGATSLSAGAAAGVLLIPTYKAINLAISSTYGFDKEIAFYHPLGKIIDNLVPGTSTSLEFGAANIYGGVLLVVLVLAYIFNRAVCVRRRIFYLLMTAFMLVSFNLNILDFVWHGFHFPNQLPGRQSFLFIFLTVYIAYECIRSIKSIRFFLFPLAGIAGVILYCFKINESADIRLRYIAIALSVVYTVVLLLSILIKKDKKNILVFAVALIFVAEISANSMYGFAQYGKTSDAVFYTQNDKTITELTKSYESGGDDFHRVEMATHFTFNPGMLYGYDGLTYYSSTMTGDAYNAMGKLGFDVYAKNVSRIYVPSPIINSMFSVKYIFDNTGSFSLSAHDSVEQYNGVTVYENTACLPIAYTVDKSILDWKTTENEGNFIDVQNELMTLSGAAELDILESQDFVVENCENATAYKVDKNTMRHVTTDQNSPVKLTYKSIASKTGTAYVYLCQPNNGIFEVYADGKLIKRIEGTGFYTKLVSFPVEEGAEIKIKTESVNKAGYFVHILSVAICDDTAFINAVNNLKDGGLDITSFKNTKIKGSITADKDKILFTSIPNDGGWSLYCDGEKLETLTLGSMFVGAEIPEGTHDIELRYEVPGLKMGLAATFAGCLLMAAVWFVLKKQAQKQGLKKTT